jgi:hypothetical protein
VKYIFSVKITIDDYIHSEEAFINRGFSKYIRIMIYVGLIVIIIINIFRFFVNFTSTFAYTIPYILVLLLIIFFKKIVSPILRRRQYNADKGLQQVQNIKIDKGSISINTDRVYTKSDIIEIIENNENLYVYVIAEKKIRNIIFNKTFVENLYDYETFKQFIKGNYGK